MWYLDKKGILEHCGKDGKDVRRLDRAMKRGEVIHDVDMGYITVVDYIWELEEEIERLKSLKEGEGKNTLCSENATRSTDATLEEKVKELESDLEFQISENERLEADKVRYQEAIKNSYLYMINVLKKKMDWYTYKATIKLEWEIKWEDNQ